MKFFVKLMLALLVIAVLLPFTILKDQNGNTLMSFSDLGLPDFSVPSMPKTSSLGTTGGSRTDLFYQWQDSSGTVQFTTEPPPEGVDYEIKKYNPDTNLIKAVDIPVEEEEVPEDNKASAGNETEINIGNQYNPEDIKKLIEDAKGLEKTLQKRYDDQNSALN